MTGTRSAFFRRSAGREKGSHVGQPQRPPRLSGNQVHGRCAFETLRRVARNADRVSQPREIASDFGDAVGELRSNCGAHGSAARAAIVGR